MSSWSPGPHLLVSWVLCVSEVQRPRCPSFLWGRASLLVLFIVVFRHQEQDAQLMPSYAALEEYTWIHSLIKHLLTSHCMLATVLRSQDDL